MTIKRLSATFGGVIKGRLTLRPGLNIIQGENERGKSTWCAFIRAMLYGINTRERSAAGFIADKEKYRPWSGAPMEGVMELDVNGQDIAIQRTALGASPMKKISAKYTNTGQEVTSLSHENLGETLTGVPESVFARSAFIRQAGMKIDQTNELEKRITALVSSGEETISFTDTTDKLGTWLRKRKHNKSGQIPTLHAEIEAIDDTLARLTNTVSTYNEVSLDLARANTRVEELSADQHTHVELERRTMREKIKSARDRAQMLAQERTKVERALAEAGGEISKAQLATAREDYNALTSLTLQYTNAKTAREDREREVLLITEELSATPFSGMEPDEAKIQVDRAHLEQESAQKAEDFPKQRYTISLAVLPVLAIAIVALSLITGWFLYPVSILLLIGAAVVGVLLLRKWGLAKNAKKRVDTMLARFGAADIPTLDASFASFCRLHDIAAERRAQAETAEREGEAIMERMTAHKDAFESAVRQFCPSAADLSQAMQAMTETEKRLEKRDALQTEHASATALLQTLTDSYDGDPDEPIPTVAPTTPLRNKSETSYDLKRMEKERDALKNSQNLALGEMRALGDPVALGTKRKALEDELEEREKQHAALSLALDVLKEADAEISARFSPLLGQKAGEYLDKLTGGTYKRVVFDKQLTPAAECAGESISRDILYLSGGTIDQVYLALRLAICDLTLPADNACPIILDDALISFDDARLKNALKLLQEISATRQVILFTCQDREARSIASDSSVNAITI